MKDKTPSKAQALKLVDSFYYRLERICESTHHWDRYLDQHKDEERRHRRGAPDGWRSGLTVPQSVRLFAVKHLLEARVSALYRPVPEDVFTIKASISGAWVMFSMYKAKIIAEFSEQESRDWLNVIDYAELVKGSFGRQIEA